MSQRNTFDSSQQQLHQPFDEAKAKSVDWWHSTPAKLMKVLWSFLAAPFSVLFEFFKGFICFVINPTPYVRTGMIVSRNHPDKIATFRSFAFGAARIGGVFTTIIAGLWILGFTASLIVPIPGIAPLYALATTALAKYGVLLLAALIGRTIGATVGSIIEYARCKSALERSATTGKEKIKIAFKFIFKFSIMAGIVIGIAGENALSLHDVGQSLLNCFRFSCRKTPKDDAAAAASFEVEKLKNTSRSSTGKISNSDNDRDLYEDAYKEPAFFSTASVHDQLQSSQPEPGTPTFEIVDHKWLLNNRDRPESALKVDQTKEGPKMPKYRSMPDWPPDRKIDEQSVRLSRVTF